MSTVIGHQASETGFGVDEMRAQDENLLVVAAVEGYSRRHHLPTKKVIELFVSCGLLQLIRQNYPTLHTQSLDDRVDFAEDVLARA